MRPYGRNRGCAHERVMWVRRGGVAAVVEPHRSHRRHRCAVVEVMDDGAASSAHPNAVWRINTRIPAHQHRPGRGQRITRRAHRGCCLYPPAVAVDHLGAKPEHRRIIRGHLPQS